MCSQSQRCPAAARQQDVVCAVIFLFLREKGGIIWYKGDFPRATAPRHKGDCYWVPSRHPSTWK